MTCRPKWYHASQTEELVATKSSRSPRHGMFISACCCRAVPQSIWNRHDYVDFAHARVSFNRTGTRHWILQKIAGHSTTVCYFSKMWKKYLRVRASKRFILPPPIQSSKLSWLLRFQNKCHQERNNTGLFHSSKLESVISLCLHTDTWLGSRRRFILCAK